MARLTIGQKAQRVLRMLMGLRHPRVATSLAAYGFNQTQLNEGWDYLRAVSGQRLAERGPRLVEPAMLERLDTFENRWFPIAQATLRRHHPEVGDWLFLNLAQTAGLEVIVSVGTFVQRLNAMERQALPGAVEARALLAQRGLGGEELAEIERLLAKLPGVQEPAPHAGPSVEEQQAAEAAMWSWYLEWSQIARVAIHDRRLLRALGFRATSRAAKGTDVDAEADPDLDEALELDEGSGAGSVSSGPRAVGVSAA